MKTAQIIINVGYLRDAVSSPNFGTAYLAQDDSGNYFIVVWKATYKDASGVDIPAGWGWISRSKILSGEFENNISNSVKNLLVSDPSFGTDEILQYNNLKTGVITNGATLAALTTNIKPLASEIPLMYTAVGTGFVLGDVKEDLGLSGLTVPTLTKTGELTTANVFPTLDKNPVDAIKAAIASPIEFAKANPISAGVIVLGAWEAFSFVTEAKNSPLIMVGVRKAPGGRRRR